MKRKHLIGVLAIAFAIFAGTTAAHANTDTAPANGKLTVAPAVLTSSGEAKAPITEVQYRGRAYRRGWYGYPYRSYGYYPRYSYSYYPRYSYGYYPRYGYSYYRPYYGGYYPRYYTGYRSGFSYYTPGFYGSFYW